MNDEQFSEQMPEAAAEADRVDAPAEVEQAPQRSGTVRWTGSRSQTPLLPHERVITVANWKAARGLPPSAPDGDLQQVVWNHDNNYQIPLSDLYFLSDHELDLFIDRDPNFIIERESAE